MPKDLTIRLLGRPQVTEDDQVGYHKVTRQYVIEGYRAEYAEVNHAQNPLFLAVGTEDEEYTNHYLVDQKINPAQGTMDKAYLVRVFAEIRDTYVQESVQASNDLRRVRRTYVVLRNEHPRGYNAESWARHPQNPQNPDDYKNEPWDYAPPVISSPDSLSYESAEFTVNGKIPTFEFPQDDTTAHPSTYSVLSSYNSFNTGAWLNGAAQVSMSQPGVDVWSVEWITHSNSYLTSSLKRTGSNRFRPPKIVELDHHGLKISDFGSGSGVNQLGQVASYVSFFVADAIPVSLSSSWGGSSNFTPSVMLDFYLEGYEHDDHFNQHRLLTNAVYQMNTLEPLTFPNLAQYNDPAKHPNIVVARKDPFELVFVGNFSKNPDYSTTTTRSVIYEKDSSGTPIVSGGTDYDQVDEDLLPHFKGKPIAHAGGRISWNLSITNLANYATLIGVTVTPVASSSKKDDQRKIWRVVTTYAG